MKKSFLAGAAVAVAALAVAGAAHGEDTLKKIKDSGSITEGVRESSGALAFTLGDGKYTGFHYDVCAHIIDDIKKHLGMSKIDVKYQPVTSQNRIPLVQNGTVDLECGSTTNNAARQKDVAFAPALYVEEVRIAVKKNSGIKGIADLNGKTVATTTGTTSVQLLRKNKKAQGMDFKELNGKDHSDSFLLLESGRADAFVMDGQILAGLISKAKNPGDFAIVGEPLSVEPIAIMYRKDDPAFKKVVDAATAALFTSGEGERLYDKWFMQKIPPKGLNLNTPIAPELKTEFAHPSDSPDPGSYKAM